MRDRPVFLNLFKIRLPLSGFISILHRVSGVLFFLGLPILLLLYQGLPSDHPSELIDHFYIKLIVWLLIVAYQYHFIAGLRHLLSDFGHYHSLRFANISGILVLLLSLIFAIWSGLLIFGEVLL